MAPLARNGENDKDPASIKKDDVHQFAKHFPNAPADPPTQQDREKWQGFCEIESEPAFFNVMLREFGVRGVKVQEVFSLDEEMLAFLPRPVHGLIFLSRYRAEDETKQEASCPPHVWFANQTHQNACATVSLLNIINNIPDPELGGNLSSFREFSANFPPALRGDAIGDFDFIKRIHNSFARKMDMLNVDLALQNEYDDAKSKKSEKKRKQMSQVTQDDYEDDDAAFHFIAYVPIGDEVWKLDGLDRQPQKLGKCSDGEWLSVITPVLTDKMAQYEEGQIEFGLLGIVHDPLLSHQKQLAGIIKGSRLVEARLGTVHPRWRETLISQGNPNCTDQTMNETSHILQQLGIWPHMIDEAEAPASVQHKLHSESLDDLAKLRSQLEIEQKSLRGMIRDEQSSHREDEQRARERRHDYGPMIKEWLEMLAGKDGVLRDLIHEARC